jgi:hypothetical protein
MRFAFFSSPASRRSITQTSIQSFTALFALVMLTGAKGQGCGGVEVDPVPSGCESGFHQETVCSPHDLGRVCEAQCVPDGQCPAGTEEQWTCLDAPIAAPACDGVGCPPPPPSDCYLECIRPNPCNDGFHEEWICGVSTSVAVSTSVSSGGGIPMVPPPAPEPCSLTCVPDSFCPPGTVEQTTCSGSSSTGTSGAGGYGGEPFPVDPACWTECVTVEPPICPPGYEPQTVCSEGTTSSSTGGGGYGGQGGSGGALPYEPSCWTECVEVEPPICPPGYEPQTVCSEGTTSSSTGGGGYGGCGNEPFPGEPACWTECVPVP